MKTGIELIAEERQEQIKKHGYSVEDDVYYNDGNQLVQAIMLVISNIGFQNAGFQMPKEAFEDLRPHGWGREILFKILDKPIVDQLKIIGAWAGAEIDRLQAIKEITKTKTEQQ